MVRFLKPADVAGTSFLSVEQQTRDDDQYLYLPSLDKSKRISGGRKISALWELSLPMQIWRVET